MWILKNYNKTKLKKNYVNSYEKNEIFNELTSPIQVGLTTLSISTNSHSNSPQVRQKKSALIRFVSGFEFFFD